MLLFSYPSVLTCVLVAQKNSLIETVLLSTHNICFGWEIRKIIFCYTLLSGGLWNATDNNGIDQPVHPHSLISTFIICFLESILISLTCTGLHSAVGNMSGNRCESDCRSRGPQFDHGPVPYFHGDWSWNNFNGHSPHFRWIVQEGLLSVTSESMCTKY